MRKIFSNFVCFSDNPNFTDQLIWLLFQHGVERKADRIPSHFNVQITSWVVSNRVLLWFEFHIPHQILYTTLTVNEKWQFHISYQNLTQQISWKNIPILYFQSHFFQGQKPAKFAQFFFFEEYQTRRPTFINEIFWKKYEKYFIF